VIFAVGSTHNNDEKAMDSKHRRILQAIGGNTVKSYSDPAALPARAS
jgi:hypothetical protein